MPKTFPEPQAFENGPAPLIAMDSVESSQIKAIGYHPETRTLAVTFTRGSGAIYHYTDVPESVYQDFIKAESIGGHFGKHIKHLPFKKYAPEPAAA